MEPESDRLQIARLIARVAIAIILLLVVVGIILHPTEETAFYLAILTAVIAFLTFLTNKQPPGPQA